MGEPDSQCGRLGFHMFGLARDDGSSERTGETVDRNGTYRASVRENWPQGPEQGLDTYMGIWLTCPRVCMTFGFRHQVTTRDLLEIDRMKHSVGFICLNYIRQIL